MVTGTCREVVRTWFWSAVGGSFSRVTSGDWHVHRSSVKEVVERSTIHFLVHVAGNRFGSEDETYFFSFFSRF